MKYIFCTLIALWQIFSGQMNAFAVNPNDIIRLKKAGVSDGVIKEIVNMNAISRALISVDEIVGMKEVDIGDEVILAIVQQGNVSSIELDQEDAKDRVLKRKIDRLELRLDIQKKEMDLLVEYVSRLITNPDLIRLVHEGKIAGEDYAEIVKYLKQYARDEETGDYSDNGDINIDINKVRR